MEQDIPKILFDKRETLGIEVMNFAELTNKLTLSTTHDPYSMHRIKFFLILIISKHSYTHFVDFQAYELTEGGALFIAQNQVHHFTEELKAAQGFCMVFNSSFLKKEYFFPQNQQLNRLFNYHIETPVIKPEEMGQDSMLGIATKLYQEYHFPNSFAKAEMLYALLHVLLLKAERAKESQAITGIKTDWLERFNQFKSLLEVEYVHTRSSRDYAGKLFISYKFLNEIVKTLSGKTVKAFIDDFVTVEIKRYLLSTSMSVKEISYKTGFEEPANMIKFFKKNAHTTPRQFRQQS